MFKAEEIIKERKLNELKLLIMNENHQPHDINQKLTATQKETTSSQVTSSSITSDDDLENDPNYIYDEEAEKARSEWKINKNI
jgi:hypothetical protein